MSTTGRNDGSPPTASDVAARLRDAEFVHLIAAPDGDAVAAAGLLARALDCPFQACVATLAEDRSTDDDCTVAVGRREGRADLSVPGGPEPASATAFEAARELGADPSVALALAGVRSAGAAGGRVTEAAAASGLERGPGVAVPTEDVVDGLAHSTLFHAPFSGDRAAVDDALADLDLANDDGTRLASLVAMATVGHPDATPTASDAVGRALRPYHGGPFRTVGGLADVLECAARESPGITMACAVGHDDLADSLLEAWRSHARRAHAGLRGATTGRYDGLFVVRDDGDLPVLTAARLARDFRSPEPVVLALTPGEAAVVSTDDRPVGAAMAETAVTLDGTADVTDRYARMRFQTDAASVITTFREAL